MVLEEKVSELVEGMYVIKVDKCKKCNGTGFITHHLWEEYWKIDHDHRPTPEEFASDRGYDEPPPEEVLCYKCGGVGNGFVFYPLRDAIRELEVLKKK